jgi:hypothetical protein
VCCFREAQLATQRLKQEQDRAFFESLRIDQQKVRLFALQTGGTSCYSFTNKKEQQKKREEEKSKVKEEELFRENNVNYKRINCSIIIDSATKFSNFF